MASNNHPFLCEFCGSQFSYKRNLQTHKKEKHNVKVSKSLKCDYCGAQFNHVKNLKRHEINKHNIVYNRFKSDKIFKCEMCDAQYSRKQTLKEHESQVHKLEAVTRRNASKHHCPLCSYEAPKYELLKHYNDIHNINITTKSETFPNLEEFHKWKKNTEVETKEIFIQVTACQKTASNIKHYYFSCHRSGNYMPTGNRQRHIKIQGSKKINAFCPASMKITELEDGSCTLQFTDTHVGHENDLGHLFLSSSERLEIASKIANKIPFDTILNEIRDSVTESNLERVHLLTKKDLYNIEKAFNLSEEGMRHENDAVSIECWIQEVKESNDQCNLYYKPQGLLLT